jgi:hypothetical protein
MRAFHDDPMPSMRAIAGYQQFGAIETLVDKNHEITLFLKRKAAKKSGFLY